MQTFFRKMTCRSGGSGCQEIGLEVRCAKSSVLYHLAGRRGRCRLVCESVAMMEEGSTRRGSKSS